MDILSGKHPVTSPEVLQPNAASRALFHLRLYPVGYDQLALFSSINVDLQRILLADHIMFNRIFDQRQNTQDGQMP